MNHPIQKAYKTFGVIPSTYEEYIQQVNLDSSLNSRFSEAPHWVHREDALIIFNKTGALHDLILHISRVYVTKLRPGQHQMNAIYAVLQMNKALWTSGRYPYIFH